MNVIAIQIDVFAVTGLCGVLDNKRDSSVFKFSADTNGISGVFLIKKVFRLSALSLIFLNSLIFTTCSGGRLT